jgi:2-isopropylmalate synthase
MEYKNIKIFDTTLRDGQQASGANLSISEKIKIAKFLDKLNVDIVEAGFPISSKKEFLSVKKISKILKNSKVCSLARHNKKDIDLCIEAMKHSKNKRLHIFIATSDLHMKYKLNLKRFQVLELIEDTMKYARNKIDDIEWSCEDGTRSDHNFIIQCFNLAAKYGAKTLNIADTVGYSTPIEMFNLVKKVKNKTRGIEKCNLSVHCHNDLGMATSNTLQSIKAGANQVECTINGLGERAGNTPLEEVVMAIETRKDYFKKKTRIKTPLLKKSSEIVSKLSSFNVSKNKPIVGENAFAHESGIHQHGVINKRETYEIIDPKQVGHKTQINIGAQSGIKGIKYKLENYNLNYKKINLKKFLKFFKSEVKNLKIVDKALLIKLYTEFTKKNSS